MQETMEESEKEYRLHPGNGYIKKQRRTIHVKHVIYYAHHQSLFDMLIKNKE